MGENIKITVIATGFGPENPGREKSKNSDLLKKLGIPRPGNGSSGGTGPSSNEVMGPANGPEERLPIEVPTFLRRKAQ
jgi:hypothetical protein